MKRLATLASVLAFFLAAGVGRSESGPFRPDSKPRPAATQAGTVPSSPKTGICPDELPLPSPPGAESAIRAYLQKAIPTLYTNIKWTGYRITDMYPAPTRPEGYGRMAANLCGKAVADRTWIVILYFPGQAPDGASTSQGQLFVGLFPTGWRAWFRYH